MMDRSRRHALIPLGGITLSVRHTFATIGGPRLSSEEYNVFILKLRDITAS